MKSINEICAKLQSWRHHHSQINLRIEAKEVELHQIPSWKLLEAMKLLETGLSSIWRMAKEEWKPNKQLSEDHMLRMSQEMLKIMHQHHLSTGNQKYSFLNKSLAKGLDNQWDEDFLKEMSNFMEPREIISIFSMERRETPNNYQSNQRENAINSVQLSTLSTNPK